MSADMILGIRIHKVKLPIHKHLDLILRTEILLPTRSPTPPRKILTTDKC